MASPMVAGLVGLMVSYAQSASQQDIVSCLLSSCDETLMLQMVIM